MTLVGFMNARCLRPRDHRQGGRRIEAVVLQAHARLATEPGHVEPYVIHLGRKRRTDGVMDAFKAGCRSWTKGHDDDPDDRSILASFDDVEVRVAPQRPGPDARITMGVVSTNHPERRRTTVAGESVAAAFSVGDREGRPAIAAALRAAARTSPRLRHADDVVIQCAGLGRRGSFLFEKEDADGSPRPYADRHSMDGWEIDLFDHLMAAYDPIEVGSRHLVVDLKPAPSSILRAQEGLRGTAALVALLRDTGFAKTALRRVLPSQRAQKGP